MRESVAREFIEMSTAYAKDTAHVRKQFETSAEQSQHLTTFAQKDIPTHGRSMLLPRRPRDINKRIVCA